jgi:hypothetical protein
MTATSPNFALLDVSRPDVAMLVAAMLQARDAVERRSWAHPQEPTGEAWWADVLADPRARKRERRTDLAVKQAFYRLGDERREIILVACSKCDWRAARFRATTSSPSTVPTTPCPTYSTISPHRIAVGSALIGIAAACTTSNRSRARRTSAPTRRRTDGISDSDSRRSERRVTTKKLLMLPCIALCLAVQPASAHRITGAEQLRTGAHWCNWSAATVCTKWRARGGKFNCTPGNNSVSCRIQRRGTLR